MAPFNKIKTYSNTNSSFAKNTSRSVDVINALFAQNLKKRIEKTSKSRRKKIKIKELPLPDVGYNVTHNSINVSTEDTFDKIARGPVYNTVNRNDAYTKVNTSESDLSTSKVKNNSFSTRSPIVTRHLSKLNVSNTSHSCITHTFNTPAHRKRPRKRTALKLDDTGFQNKIFESKQNSTGNIIDNSLEIEKVTKKHQDSSSYITLPKINNPALPLPYRKPVPESNLPNDEAEKSSLLNSQFLKEKDLSDSFFSSTFHSSTPVVPLKSRKTIQPNIETFSEDVIESSLVESYEEIKRWNYRVPDIPLHAYQRPKPKLIDLKDYFGNENLTSKGLGFKNYDYTKDWKLHVNPTVNLGERIEEQCRGFMSIEQISSVCKMNEFKSTIFPNSYSLTNQRCSRNISNSKVCITNCDSDYLASTHLTNGKTPYKSPFTYVTVRRHRTHSSEGRNSESNVKTVVEDTNIINSRQGRLITNNSRNSLLKSLTISLEKFSQFEEKMHSQSNIPSINECSSNLVASLEDFDVFVQKNYTFNNSTHKRKSDVNNTNNYSSKMNFVTKRRHYSNFEISSKSVHDSFLAPSKILDSREFSTNSSDVHVYSGLVSDSWKSNGENLSNVTNITDSVSSDYKILESIKQPVIALEKIDTAILFCESDIVQNSVHSENNEDFRKSLIINVTRLPFQSGASNSSQRNSTHFIDKEYTAIDLTDSISKASELIDLTGSEDDEPSMLKFSRYSPLFNESQKSKKCLEEIDEISKNKEFIINVTTGSFGETKTNDSLLEANKSSRCDKPCSKTDKDGFAVPSIGILNTQSRVSLNLKPGKPWQRCLSAFRRRTVLGPVDEEKYNLQDSFESRCKGRQSIRPSKRFSVRVVPVSSQPFSEGNATVLESYAQTKSGYVPGAEDNSQIDLENGCFRSISIRSSNRTTLVPIPAPLPLVTAEEVVLRRCGQTGPLAFEKCYPSSALQHCQKIGEGVYGEVFLYRNQSGGTTVMKVIPIQGDLIVNGERQKKYEEILSEIIISMELSNLRNCIKNNTSGFSEVQKVRCVRGCYPRKLLDLWDLYDETRNSENDSPEVFSSDQLYIVLELANCGRDLEAFVFNNALQVYSVFKQVACSLAVAERELRFEHRDLHWGNVLISQVEKNKKITVRLGEKEIELVTHGVQAAVIDFTLSRIEYDGVVIFNDLGLDPDLFTAEGDYQFEIYRLMKMRNGNDWQEFEPYTNILWLHYILDKAVTALRYKNTQSKIHKEYIAKLKKTKNEILNYNSVSDFVVGNFY